MDTRETNPIIDYLELLFENGILDTDAYKLTHPKQYKKGTKRLFAYFESRGGMFKDLCFFGLQMYIERYVAPIRITHAHIDAAVQFSLQMFGFNYVYEEGWRKVVNEYKGIPPIRIKAVPEGTIVPVNNVLMTVESLDDDLAFLTNFYETTLTNVWYTITVATMANEIMKLGRVWAEKTGCELSPFFVNDFGARGVTCPEQSGLGGAAVLVSSLGTDTMKGIRYAMKYYGANVCGHSVFATEHSTTTSFGRNGEVEAMAHFLNAAPDEAIMAMVIDSYDPDNFVRNIAGTTHKDKILARKGKVVFRPDSGVPWDMSLKIMDILWEKFGGTINTKGFKVLNPKVGMIYGDGINYDSIGKILETLATAGYASSNIIFGMGGALLQGVTRDTQKFAFKASWALINDEEVEIFKDPISDPGKRSKKGRLALIKSIRDGYQTVSQEYCEKLCLYDELVTVYERGTFIRKWTFDEVRKLAGIIE